MPQHWITMRKRFLRVVLPLLRKCPPTASAAFLDACGWLDFKVFPSHRENFVRALERGREGLEGDWDDVTVARRLATAKVQWRCRDRLLDGLTDDQALARFDVEGREHFDSAYQRKRGVILLGNHFGCHLHPTHWLFREQYPIRLFTERPRNISRYLSDQFATDGPLGQEKLFISRKSTATEAAGSILRASRILKQGMILQIAGDVRWHGVHTAPGHFLGSTYLFSTTWVVLAAMTGSPVVPVFCRPDGRGKYILEYLPAFKVPAETTRNGHAATYVQRGLDAIADQVRRHPDQSNDYFEWPRPEIGLNRVA